MWFEFSSSQEETEGKGQFILRCCCTTGSVCQKPFRDAPARLQEGQHAKLMHARAKEEYLLATSCFFALVPRVPPPSASPICNMPDEKQVAPPQSFIYKAESLINMVFIYEGKKKPKTFHSSDSIWGLGMEALDQPMILLPTTLPQRTMCQTWRTYFASFWGATVTWTFTWLTFANWLGKHN